ncbi:hypothetical protein N8D56_25215 (plasmid) [Devosia sp. A8/3-2]|nr:hypothetical protein N8D56_25215 [Devosia sp. A8/3-2]
MTIDSANSREQTVGQLQRRWILEGWEKQSGESWVFNNKVGHFYDWDNPATSLHDTFDPQLRVAQPDGVGRSVRAVFRRHEQRTARRDR